jgi:tetratricopeptide (TPR) repeat protein
MPTLFSRRRLVNSGLKTDSAAGTLLLRAEVRIARDDRDGARQALEEAVRIDDSLIDAWRGLSSLYEEAQDYDKAAQVYRKLIDRDPKDASALNNLAYALAVREHQPAEALPLAERALLLQPRNPTIADTVGWIKHLLGDHAGALKLLEPAAKALPENADVQLHVAVVYAASGRIADATAALKRAEEKDPAVKDRPEYQQVMQVIR